MQKRGKVASKSFWQYNKNTLGFNFPKVFFDYLVVVY
jgi:hypothetical protein